MRDPKRIKPLLKRLEKVWMANPDLRLCQMIATPSLASSRSDLFYVEDERLISTLEYVYGRGEQ